MIVGLVDSVRKMLSLPSVMENIKGILHELEAQDRFDRTMESNKSCVDCEVVGIYVWSHISRIKNR